MGRRIGRDSVLLDLAEDCFRETFHHGDDEIDDELLARFLRLHPRPDDLDPKSIRLTCMSTSIPWRREHG